MEWVYGKTFNQSAAGLFGPKVNKLRMCTKVRGQHVVKRIFIYYIGNKNSFECACYVMLCHVMYVCMCACLCMHVFT